MLRTHPNDEAKVHSMNKITRVLVACFVLTSSSLLFGAQAQADVKSIVVGGVTVEYEDPFYCPAEGNFRDIELTVSSVNNEELLSVDITLMDKYGQSISTGRASFLKPGIRKIAAISLNEFSSSSTKCSDISKIKVFVDFYSNSPNSDISATRDLTALQIGNSKPVPSPTVTASAKPTTNPNQSETNMLALELLTLRAQVESYKVQVSSLSSKLKKICSAKPRPKGC
jgi:uncharacterized ParB-like nuclease family protein